MKIREKLDIALSEVTAAENALEGVLRELRAGVRAEKVTITTTVEGAFDRLRKSRAELARLKEEPDEE
jgi:hypothetical protein